MKRRAFQMFCDVCVCVLKVRKWNEVIRTRIRPDCVNFAFTSWAIRRGEIPFKTAKNTRCSLAVNSSQRIFCCGQTWTKIIEMNQKNRRYRSKRNCICACVRMCDCYSVIVCLGVCVCVWFVMFFENLGLLLPGVWRATPSKKVANVCIVVRPRFSYA